MTWDSPENICVADWVVITYIRNVEERTDIVPFYDGVPMLVLHVEYPFAILRQVLPNRAPIQCIDLRITRLKRMSLQYALVFMYGHHINITEKSPDE